MIMPPRLRKFILTIHVISSVGWIGAVAVFLALAITGLISEDDQMVRASYLAMELTTWLVIVPLNIVSLLSGFVQSLGTQWGLFRHYWILMKLLITIPDTIILLIHTQPINLVANMAAKMTMTSGDLHKLRIQLVVAAGVALLVLIVATTLSIYKPRGLTRYGWRKQQEQSVIEVNYS